MPNELIRHSTLSSIIDKSSTKRSSQIGTCLVKSATRSFIIDYFLSNVVTTQNSIRLQLYAAVKLKSCLNVLFPRLLSIFVVIAVNFHDLLKNGHSYRY
ncbi:hypothetical protein QLX08_011384 [Tetragonisca angustula]|uniref:Uncharacterized protein n=1 Tax=Tetragonisca angustula TaxID=166442 RepID=A0AAW0Z8Q8_9HYME